MEQPLVLEQVTQIPTLPFYNSMQSVLSESAQNQEFTFNIIYVIGVGGTGGFLVPHLSRYVSSLPYSKYTAIVLVDGDVVENKNIIRQNFVKQDIGKNKAQVLASRYSSAFGVPIIAVQNHLLPENINEIFGSNLVVNTINQHLRPDSTNFQRSGGINYIVISCVDNNKTRNLISESLGWPSSLSSPLFGGAFPCPPMNFDSIRSEAGEIFSCSSVTWIDSGNESSTGQVICSYDNYFTHGNRGSGRDITGSELGKFWNAFVEPIRYGLPSHIFSGLLDARYDWTSFLKDSEHNGSGRRLSSLNTHLRGREASIQNATDAYLYFHNRVSNEFKSLEEMKKTIILGSPDYSTQLDFMIGLCSSWGFAPLSSMITPPVTYHYPSIFESKDKLNTELSCAERAVLDPQNLMVNAQAASYIMNYVSAVLAANPHRAYLESFGCVWSGSNCQELYINESNSKLMFGEIYDKMPLNNTSSLLPEGTRALRVNMINNDLAPRLASRQDANAEAIRLLKARL